MPPALEIMIPAVTITVSSAMQHLILFFDYSFRALRNRFRQSHEKSRTFVGGRINRNPPSVLFNDSVGDIQSQAGARMPFRRIKKGEDVLAGFLVHTDAVVADLKFDELFLLPYVGCDAGLFVGGVC